MIKFFPLLLSVILFVSCKNSTDNSTSNVKDSLFFTLDGTKYSFAATGMKKDSAGETIITVNGSESIGWNMTFRLYDLYMKAGFFDIGGLKDSGSIIFGVTMDLRYQNSLSDDSHYSSSLLPGGPIAGTMVIREGFDISLKAEFAAKLPIVSGSGADTVMVTAGDLEVSLK